MLAMVNRYLTSSVSERMVEERAVERIDLRPTYVYTSISGSPCAMPISVSYLVIAM